MALPDLATIDDVAALLQRDLTAQEITNGARLLAMASGLVRRYTRQTLTAVDNETVTLPGNWSNVLTLPQRPVRSVASVTMNGGVMPATQWRLVNDDLFLGTGSFQPDYGATLWGGPALWGPAGSNHGPQATGVSWGGPSAQVIVTYSHGFEEIPADLTNVTAGLVAFAIATPVGVASERIGSYQTQYGRSEGGAMTLQAADKEVLNFYRVRATSSRIAPQR